MSYSYDWVAIRALYEEGESPAHIAEKPGMPTRQAIHQRAKREGWERRDDAVDERFPFADDPDLSAEQQIVLLNIAEGLPAKWAADKAGVHESTVRRWKKDERFARLCRAAIAWKASRRLGQIEASTDWRAQMALLERDSDTRNEFSPPNAGRGMVTGNTFNVLGHIDLGITRDEPKQLEQEQ